jgi:hypothetical protein
MHRGSEEHHPVSKAAMLCSDTVGARSREATTQLDQTRKEGGLVEAVDGADQHSLVFVKAVLGAIAVMYVLYKARRGSYVQHHMSLSALGICMHIFPT